MTNTAHIEWQWTNDPAFKKQWRRYLLWNAASRGYPLWFGLDCRWLPSQVDVPEVCGEAERPVTRRFPASGNSSGQ